MAPLASPALVPAAAEETNRQLEGLPDDKEAP
jgi:hypothetical protein